jgi:hypothetical protein
MDSRNDGGEQMNNKMRVDIINFGYEFRAIAGGLPSDFPTASGLTPFEALGAFVDLYCDIIGLEIVFDEDSDKIVSNIGRPLRT